LRTLTVSPPAASVSSDCALPKSQFGAVPSVGQSQK
jgi:hypothetical protein